MEIKHPLLFFFYCCGKFTRDARVRKMFQTLQLKDGRKNNIFFNEGDYIMKNFLKAAGQFGLWGLFIASSAVVGVSLYDLKHEIEYRKLMKKVGEEEDA